MQARDPDMTEPSSEISEEIPLKQSYEMRKDPEKPSNIAHERSYGYLPPVNQRTGFPNLPVYVLALAKHCILKIGTFCLYFCCLLDRSPRVWDFVKDRVLTRSTFLSLIWIPASCLWVDGFKRQWQSTSFIFLFAKCNYFDEFYYPLWPACPSVS